MSINRQKESMHLKMCGISKSFGSNLALDKVDFEVLPGEIHGLMGENGAGKSTLMNILAGTLTPDQGEILIGGEGVSPMTTKKATQLGIRFVHQEINVINDLKVYENLFLNEEIGGRFGILKPKEMIDRSREVFESLRIDIDPTALVFDLDTPEKQLIEIAKGLLFKAKLIIMDEPTTALNNQAIENLFTIMRSLKEKGVSLIYISHKMPELFAICDRYTVLRDGRLIESGNYSDIDESQATRLLVGKQIDKRTSLNHAIQGDSQFQVSELTAEPFFRQVDFDIKRGEVVAITGLQGDGRGELAEALFGARKVDQGMISIHGKPLAQNIVTFMENKVAMVARNRKERSILEDLTILDNASLANFVLDPGPLVHGATQKKRFDRSTRSLDIRLHNPKSYITSLSGGNQQKVILARWLQTEADVLILDNPTQGIDVGAKFEIYSLIDQMAEAGKSIIIFSAEYQEIEQVADRVLVMFKGNINGEFDRQTMSEENIMFFATGANLKEKKELMNE